MAECVRTKNRLENCFWCRTPDEAGEDADEVQKLGSLYRTSINLINSVKVQNLDFRNSGGSDGRRYANSPFESRGEAREGGLPEARGNLQEAADDRAHGKEKADANGKDDRQVC